MANLEEKKIKLKNLEEELKEIRKEDQEKRNKEYRLQKEIGRLKRELATENIGRCFVKKADIVDTYVLIIGINKGEITHGKTRLFDYFDEYRYPTMEFTFPYNDSISPFEEGEIHSSAWGKGNNYCIGNHLEISEISKEEYIEKAKIVFNKWMLEIIK